jgi:hypothetical protein
VNPWTSRPPFEPIHPSRTNRKRSRFPLTPSLILISSQTTYQPRKRTVLWSPIMVMVRKQDTYMNSASASAYDTGTFSSASFTGSFVSKSNSYPSFRRLESCMSFREWPVIKSRVSLWYQVFLSLFETWRHLFRLLSRVFWSRIAVVLGDYGLRFSVCYGDRCGELLRATQCDEDQSKQSRW